MGQVAFSCGATFFLDAARHKHGWIELLGLRGALVRNTAVNLSRLRGHGRDIFRSIKHIAYCR